MEKKDCIELFNLDVEDLVENKLKGRENLFVYFDPPYVQKGPGLYRSSFNEEKHCSLARTIQGCDFPWIATYDNDALIEKLYGDKVKETFEIRYSAYKASIGKEKLIISPQVRYSCV